MMSSSPMLLAASICRWCSLSWQYRHGSSQFDPSGGLSWCRIPLRRSDRFHAPIILCRAGFWPAIRPRRAPARKHTITTSQDSAGQGLPYPAALPALRVAPETPARPGPAPTAAAPPTQMQFDRGHGPTQFGRSHSPRMREVQAKRHLSKAQYRYRWGKPCLTATGAAPNKEDFMIGQR
jgi:hypothetical protein